MHDKNIYVLGNKFKNFASYENVYTFSEFISSIHCNKLSIKFDKLVMGQGLSMGEKKILTIISDLLTAT